MKGTAQESVVVDMLEPAEVLDIQPSDIHLMLQVLNILVLEDKWVGVQVQDIQDMSLELELADM